MLAAPSALSLVAAGLYCVVAGGTVFAWVTAVRQRQVSWHFWGWALVSVIFLALALMRVFAVEDLLRGTMREVLYSEHSYEQRRTLQGPLFAITFLIAAAMTAGVTFYLARAVKGRRNIALMAALACTAGLVFLLALRLISLHSVDELLYGPLKINWCLDLGLSLAVLFSAFRYRKVVGSRPD